MNFRLFAHGDEVSTPVAKMLQGCDDVRIVKSESEDRTMPRVGLFTDVVFPVSKAARKAEVPPGVISGDPVLSPTLDEDDDDAKSAARKIRQYAKDLDESNDDDEDSKKRKLKAFAKRNGVILRDEDADDAKDDDDDEDSAKRKGKRKGGAVTAGPKDEDDDEMKAGDKAGRGIAHYGRKVKGFNSAVTKVSFGDIIHATDPTVGTFDPMTEAETMSSPRRADTGVDALNRGYENEVLARLGGGLRAVDETEDSAIPRAGGIDPWLGDTRTTPNSGFRPFRSGEGDRGHIVTDKGNPPARPNQGRSGPYTTEADNVAVEGGGAVPATLPGGMRVMSPNNSGIRGPSGFAPSFNSSMMSVLKSAGPRHPGLFKNLILAPDPHGCTPPGPRGE